MVLTLVIIMLAFISGVMIVMALAAPPPNKTLLDMRIDTIVRSGANDVSDMPSLADAEMDASFLDRVVRPSLRTISQAMVRLSPAGAADTARTTLIKAGNPAGLDVAEFMGLRFVSILVFSVIAFFAQSAFQDDTTMRFTILGFFVLAGFAMPDVYLSQQIAVRQAKIRKVLPDTIDLLIVSVEAGMGFDGAIAKVVEKMRGPLPDEFARMMHEMRLGKPRAQAMRDLALRVDIPELTTFAAAIFQSEQLGVSIANVLRVQSESIRIARTQRIRTAAAKLPVKMLFPLIFFIFPAIFVVMLAPGFIGIIDGFKNM